MKLVFLSVLAMSSLSAFAATPSEVISEIEATRNVKCDYVKSSFAICLGAPRQLATCRYSETYACFGAESLKVKLGVKESYSPASNTRISKVTKVKYL